MEHNTADMGGLTNLMLKKVVRQEVKYPVIAGIEPRRVSACDNDIIFQIWGDNIWRATEVNFGGKLIQGANVTVLPDMSGVLAKVNMTEVPVIRGQKAKLTVLTKDGRSSKLIEFIDVRKDGNICQTPSAPAPEPKGPVITSVAPATISICDPSPSFTVTGKNLGSIQTASLGTVKSTVGSRKKTILTIFVSTKNIKKKLMGLSSTPLILHSDTGVGTTDISISHIACK